MYTWTRITTFYVLTRVLLLEDYKAMLKLILQRKSHLQMRVKEDINSIIAVGNYIATNGHMVKTQEVGKIYENEKGCGAATRKTSMELYDIFSKHLNIVQIHMCMQGGVE